MNIGLWEQNIRPLLFNELRIHVCHVFKYTQRVQHARYWPSISPTPLSSLSLSFSLFLPFLILLYCNVSRGSGRTLLWGRIYVIRREWFWEGRGHLEEVKMRVVLSDIFDSFHTPPISFLVVSCNQQLDRCIPKAQLDPLSWQPLNWLFGGTHLSLISFEQPIGLLSLSLLRSVPFRGIKYLTSKPYTFACTIK